MADYTLSVRIDKEKLIADYLNAMKSVKDKANSDDNITKFKIVADEKTFLDSVKKMLSTTGILEKDIQIGIDTEYYKKSLNKLNGYTDKTMSQIRSSLGKGFTDLEKYDLQQVIEGNLSSNKVKNKIKELRDYISSSMKSIDVGDYRQVDGLLEKVRVLQSVTEQISKKGKYNKYSDVFGGDLTKSSVDELITSVKSQYSQAMMANREKYVSQMQTEMKQESDYIQNMFAKVLSTLFDETGQLRTNISDAISSGVQDGVKDSQAALDELESQVTNISKKINDLKISRKDSDNIGLNYEDQAANLEDKLDDIDNAEITEQDINAYIESTQKYVQVLDKSSKAYKNVVEQYNEISSLLGDNVLPPIEEMKTYGEVMNELQLSQLKVEAKMKSVKKSAETTSNLKEVDETINKTDELSETLNEAEKQSKSSTEAMEQGLQEARSEVNKTKEEIRELAEEYARLEYQKGIAEPRPNRSIKEIVGDIDTEQQGLINLAGKKHGIKSDDFLNLVDFNKINQEVADYKKQREELSKPIIIPGLGEDSAKTTENIKEEKEAIESVTEAIEEKQKAETQDKVDSSSVESEIEDLKVLKEKLEEVQQAIKNKTDEFGNEVTAVDGFVKSEIDSLTPLLDALNDIEQKIKDTIDTLKNSDGKDIILTPKLSQGYRDEIQNTLLNKTFKIKLSPELTSTFVETAQNKLDNLGGIKVKSYEDEKALNIAATDFSEKLTSGFKVSKKTAETLKDEIKSIITMTQTGGNVDTSSLFGILGEDENYLKQRYSAVWEEWDKVRKYVNKSKIRYSDTDAAEFGDDFTQVRNKIGVGVMSKDVGTEPLVFLRELQDALGVTFEDVNTTQGAIEALYNFLNNPPNLKELFEKDIANGEIKNYNEELMGVATNLDSLKIFYDKIISMYDNYLERLTEKVIEEESVWQTRNNSIIQKMDQLDVNKKKDIDDSFNQEDQITQSTVQSEISALAPLREAIDKVIEAIDKKTQAFKEEGQVVEGVVQNEITNLTVLSGYIIELRNDVLKLQEAFDHIGINVSLNNDADITNFISKLSRISDNKIDTKLVTVFSALDDFVKGVNKLKLDDSSILSSIDNLLSKSKELENLATALKTDKNKIKAVEKKVTKGESTEELSNVDEAIKQYNRLYDAQIKIAKNKEGTNEPLMRFYVNEIEEAQKALDGLILTEEEAATVSEKTSKKQIEAANQIAEADRKADETLQNTIKTAENLQATVKKQATSMLSNGKLMAEFGDQVKDAIIQIDAIDTSINPTEAISQLKKVQAELKGIQSAAEMANKSGQTFGQMVTQRFKSLGAYLATFVQFYDIVRYVRQAASSVQELDKQMIELAKVSEQSLGQIKSDFASYSDVAKDLGATITDTISATADWARLGYSVPDAKQLAEVALLYKNVGDGIDINAANESLISTLQGFKMNAEDAMEIIDKFNEVANTEAISSAGIGEALQRSAAAFNAANTSLSESIALVTATNAVIQNPEKVGTMWTTVAARLRGAKAELQEMGEDTEDMVESTSKLRDLVKGMTGFDIMEGEDTYKSIYDIIQGIGQVWGDLKDIDRAALLEALAGKRRSNELAAVLNNIEGLSRAYETAENSAGKQNCLSM